MIDTCDDLIRLLTSFVCCFPFRFMQFEFSSYETCLEIYSLEEKVFIVHYTCVHCIYWYTCVG